MQECTSLGMLSYVHLFLSSPRCISVLGGNCAASKLSCRGLGASVVYTYWTCSSETQLITSVLTLNRPTTNVTDSLVLSRTWPYLLKVPQPVCTCTCEQHQKGVSVTNNIAGRTKNAVPENDTSYCIRLTKMESNDNYYRSKFKTHFWQNGSTKFETILSTNKTHRRSLYTYRNLPGSQYCSSCQSKTGVITPPL